PRRAFGFSARNRAHSGQMALRSVIAAAFAARVALGATEAAAAFDTPATEQHTPETALIARATEFHEPYFPFLDDEDPTASVSVGDTSHGYVVNAKLLVES